MACALTGQNLKLLLVGKTGVGKSSTANSILGEPKFEARLSMSSVTMETQYAELCRFGRHLVLVDTPGFFDTHRDNQYITTEIMRICGYLTSGFHALLYVISLTERFSEESIKTKNLFLKLFGESVRNHTIIVITHSDSLESCDAQRQKFLKTGSAEFQDFLELFDKRVFFINNNADKEEIDSQVTALFGEVDKLVSRNDGGCFSTFHMKMARAFTRLEKNKRKKGIIKARRLLFRKARNRLGLKDKVVWNTQTNAPAIYNPTTFVSYKKPMKATCQRKSSDVLPSTSKIKPKSVPRIKSEPVLRGLGDRNTQKSLSRTIEFGSAEDSFRQESGEVTKADDNESDTEDTSAIDAEAIGILKELDGDTEHHKASDEVTVELDADIRKELKNKDFFDEFADFFRDMFSALLNK